MSLIIRNLTKKFDDKTVDSLLRIRWWDQSPEWIAEHASDFSDVAPFTVKYDNENKDV